MGMNFDQAMEKAGSYGADSVVYVTIVTNQDNGIVSYATGPLFYSPSHSGGSYQPERLSGTLPYLFSDRTTSPGIPLIQPFSINQTDKITVSISKPPSSKPAVTFTLLNWGNATFTVPTDPLGNLLVGVGAPVGNLADQAVYVISFGRVEQKIK